MALEAAADDYLMTMHSGVAPAELPVLPTLKGRGMAVLWSPNSDLRDLLSIVEGDPGLTASMLRAANSSFAAPTGPIRTAAGALERLGVDGAKQVVTAAFTRAEFEHLNRSDIHFEDYWAWQLAVGLLTELLCLADGRPADEVEAAFTTGLLHQVGRLSLIARNPEGYRAVVALVNEGTDPLEAEWQLLNDDAAHVTAQIGTHWGFFDPIASALANPGADELGALISEAAALAAHLGFNQGFALQAPALAELPDSHPRAAALAQIGGLEGLVAQIRWFHQATGGRTPLTLAADDSSAPDSDRLAS